MDHFLNSPVRWNHRRDILTIFLDYYDKTRSFHLPSLSRCPFLWVPVPQKSIYLVPSFCPIQNDCCPDAGRL